MVQEAESVSKLLMSSTSQNLVRTFFLQEGLKAQAKCQKLDKIDHVHVIGAGVMGADIASWCALKGLHVTLADQNPQALASGAKRVYSMFKKQCRGDKLALQQVADRFLLDPEGHGVRSADVVIEAIIEDLTAKQNVFKAIELWVKPGAILATNTSSILQEIAKVLQKPARLVNIHFFNPVAKMQLVEVVCQRFIS